MKNDDLLLVLVCRIFLGVRHWSKVRNDDTMVEVDDAGAAFDDVVDHCHEGFAHAREDYRMCDGLLGCTFHDGDDIQKVLAAGPSLYGEAAAVW